MIEEVISEMLEGKYHQRVIMPTSELDFETEVKDACKANFCGRYNKSWTCPPNAGTLEENKARVLAYKTAYVYTTVGDIEDSFDIEGMGEVRKKHSAYSFKIIAELKKRGFDFNFLSVGSCELCEKCSYPDSPCRHPDKMYYSVESQGINVVSLARKQNINYINGANTVTYFSIFLYN